MNRNTTIQNTPMRKTTITGKHREYLIELMLYHIKTQQETYGISTGVSIDDVRQQNTMGNYWVTYYIDDYVDRMIPWKQTYKQTK